MPSGSSAITRVCYVSYLCQNSSPIIICCIDCIGERDNLRTGNSLLKVTPPAAANPCMIASETASLPGGSRPSPYAFGNGPELEGFAPNSLRMVTFASLSRCCVASISGTTRPTCENELLLRVDANGVSGGGFVASGAMYTNSSSPLML